MRARIVGLAAMSLVRLERVPGRDESQPTLPLRLWEGGSCGKASFSSWRCHVPFQGRQTWEPGSKASGAGAGPGQAGETRPKAREQVWPGRLGARNGQASGIGAGAAAGAAQPGLCHGQKNPHVPVVRTTREKMSGMFENGRRAAVVGSKQSTRCRASLEATEVRSAVFTEDTSS